MISRAANLAVMIKSLCLALLIFGLPGFLSAQTSDMVVLRKKNNKTDRTLFAGMLTEFGTVDGRWISGQIIKVQRDTVFLSYFDIRRVPTRFGTFVMDTIARLPVAIYYKDIKVFRRKKAPFQFIRDGKLFKIGAVGYALLNLVNGKYLNESLTDNQNMKSLSIAGGVFAAGFVMGKLHPSMLVVGKKYHLKYIPMRN